MGASMKQSGFTLLEMMVTVSLVAIVSGLAVPSIGVWLDNARVDGAANNFVASIGMARTEAVRRGQSVQVLPITLTTDWSKGWCVRIVGGAVSCNSTDTNVVYTSEKPAPSLKMQFYGWNQFTFLATGSRAAAGMADVPILFCSPKGSGRQVTLTIMGNTKYTKLNSGCMP